MEKANHDLAPRLRPRSIDVRFPYFRQCPLHFGNHHIEVHATFAEIIHKTGPNMLGVALMGSAADPAHKKCCSPDQLAAAIDVVDRICLNHSRQTMKHMTQGGYAGFRDSAFEKSDPDGGHRTRKHHGIRKFPSFEGYLGRKHVTLGINLFRLEGRKSIYHELDGLVYFESFGQQELWGRSIMLHRGWTSLWDFFQKNQRNDVVGHDVITS